MGNVGGRITTQKANIMKIDGEIFKRKLPVTAADVLGDYPAGYVLLESESVRKHGIRAPRLRPEEALKPGKIYFLVDIHIPEFPEPETRRIGSRATAGGAEERLERLMMARRLTGGVGTGSVRVKVRVPRAQIVKLVEESRDERDAVEGIIDLCLRTIDQ